MAEKSEQFYVEVVDKNFQANIETDLGIKPSSNIGQNEFLQNSDQDEYNNKPATPLNNHQQNSTSHKNGNKNSEQQQQEEQQPSDQEPAYKLSKVLPKQNQKQRLIQQNIKLKAQIYELAKQLDEILQKDRGKKKKFGLNVIEEEDEIIRDKKLQAKKQQLQIMQLKNKIFVAKRQLDSVYNNFVVTERENLIIKLKGQLKELEKEKDGLVNITEEQGKVLKVVQNEEEYGQKLQKTHQEYMKIKTDTRRIILKTQQQERILKKKHEIYIDKLQKLKEIQQKLSINKEKSKQALKKTTQNQASQPHIQTITDQTIKTLQQEVRQLQLKKKQGERQWQQKIKSVDLQLYKKRVEQEKKMLILREKEKQLKLNEMRIRELRKMFRENQVAEKDKRTKEMDMSQFRHKRNIRYIEK